jgi:hypothetical protein
MRSMVRRFGAGGLQQPLVESAKAADRIDEVNLQDPMPVAAQLIRIAQ